MDDNQGRDTGNTEPKPDDRPPVDGLVSQDLSAVRSGDLAPYEDRPPIVPMSDSTAISPGRAIPPEQITAIVSRYSHVDPIEAMIPVLQEMQVKFGYITQAAADQMASELGISETEVYGVLTFYSFFRFSPRAGHVIMSCEGTGCYVRGAARVREAIENRLDVGPGETSADGKFTFEPQSICLGACDLGPLVDIEGTFYYHVTPEKMDAILAQWSEAGDVKAPGDNFTGGHGPRYEDNYGFGPSSNELYAGYEIERFTAQGQDTDAVATTSQTGQAEPQTRSSPPTPRPGGPTGLQGQS
jgi:NADH:ubiquinone oxidoreductase subunit E